MKHYYGYWKALPPGRRIRIAIGGALVAGAALLFVTLFVWTMVTTWPIAVLLAVMGVFGWAVVGLLDFTLEADIKNRLGR